MRKNRRKYVEKGSGHTEYAIFFCSIIVISLVFGAIWNLTLKRSISSISKEIRTLENESNRLKIEVQRAQSAWSLCTTPVQLEKSLTRHGLHMELASGKRIVYLFGKTPERIDGLGSTHTDVATYVPNQQTFQ